MRRLFFLLSITILGILQLTILDKFKIFNIRPDLLLISVGLAGLSFNLKWTLVFAVFAALFKDIFGVNTFGINTLLFPLWGFLIVRLSREISLEHSFMRMVLMLIVAFLHNIISGAIFIYLGSFIPLGIFLRIACVSSLYTAVIALLAFRIFNPLFNS